MNDPTTRLKSTVADTRLLGVIFILMGLLSLYLVYGRRTFMPWDAQVYTAVNTIILIGPGVWYVVAASLMKRRNPSAARISMLIALAQMVIVIACVLLGFLGQSDVQRLAMPACFALFQVPALIALLVTLWRASGSIEALALVGHAFEPLPIAPPADPQPTDNEREK
jgi:hypothetical protein